MADEVRRSGLRAYLPRGYILVKAVTSEQRNSSWSATAPFVLIIPDVLFTVPEETGEFKAFQKERAQGAGVPHTPSGA